MQKAIKEIPARNEQVIFACRKSPIALVALFGESIVFCYLIIAAVWYFNGPGALFALAMLPAINSIYGLLYWKSEVHIVSEFREKAGGIYRKIHGPFSLKIRETSITNATPDLTRDVPFVLRIWGWMTGQEVSKITLRSDGQTVIPSEFMPTRLYKAIAELKGEPGRSTQRSPTRVSDISRAIQSSYYDGIICKPKATSLMETLLEDELL